MTNNTSPSVITSRHRIVYRQSQWRVHQFKIIGGEVVCSVCVLRMEGSVLLWLGGGKEPQLQELAVGMPAADARPALATALLGADGAAAALARRLARLLDRPVYVCCGTEFDRFTIPLVERGLIDEIKNKPECF